MKRLNTMSALKRGKKPGLCSPLEQHWVYNPSFNKDPFDSATNSYEAAVLITMDKNVQTMHFNQASHVVV